jgi:hypothetical protein
MDESLAGPDEDAPIERITIVGALERQQIEALRLEIRRLGRRHGVDVKEPRSEMTPE